MNANLMIETHDLTRIYGDGEEIRALDEVTMSVKAGEFLAVMGPSGSGKSTLLNVLGTLDGATSGKVFVNGQDLSTLRDVDQFRAKTVGFMFQLHNLLPTLTARENVEIPMMGFLNSGTRRRRAEELLKLVGLGDRLNHLPGQLSGGQRQRVAAARALANQASTGIGRRTHRQSGYQRRAGVDASVKGIEIIPRESPSSLSRMIQVSPARPRRVLVMADGKIVREDRIGSPLEEDLKMWRHSGLGKQIVSGNPVELQALGISGHQVNDVKAVLELANG